MRLAGDAFRGLARRTRERQRGEKEKKKTPPSKARPAPGSSSPGAPPGRSPRQGKGHQPAGRDPPPPGSASGEPSGAREPPPHPSTRGGWPSAGRPREKEAGTPLSPSRLSPFWEGILAPPPVAGGPSQEAPSPNRTRPDLGRGLGAFIPPQSPGRRQGRTNSAAAFLACVPGGGAPLWGGHAGGGGTAGAWLVRGF